MAVHTMFVVGVALDIKYMPLFKSVRRVYSKIKLLGDLPETMDHK